MRGERPRIAVWGLGPHATVKILPALAASSSVELAGVCTRNVETLELVGSKYHCATWSDADDMLAESNLDVIYICSPIGMHDGQGHRVLAAGKHLWCEKSLTHDPVRSLALVHEGRRRDLAVCEAFMYEHHPQLRRVIEMIASPSFGEVTSMSIRFGMPHLERPGFRHERALGGGALLDVGCYPIHLVHKLVTSSHEVITSEICSQPEFEVDINGRALVRFASGARAALEWGFGLAYRNEVFIWGRGESMVAERIFSKKPDQTSSIVVSDSTGVSRTEHVGAANAFVAMFDELAPTVDNHAARVRWWDEADRQARFLGAISDAATRAPSHPASPH